MSKHTQGDWAVGQKCSDGIRIEVDGKCSVANVWGDNNEANARLIAAAPELLEACKIVNSSLVSHGVANTMGGRFYKEALLLAQAVTKAEEV